MMIPCPIRASWIEEGEKKFYADFEVLEFNYTY